MFKNKKILITLVSSIIVVALAIGLILIYKDYLNKQVEEGDKTVTVYVINDHGDEKYTKTYSFNTDYKFLGELLLAKMDVKVQNDGYGNYLTEVNGMKANTNNQEWWKILINGEMGDYGMDEQPIKDGDEITLEFNIGYY
jgi:hypothetical protein